MNSRAFSVLLVGALVSRRSRQARKDRSWSDEGPERALITLMA